MGLVGSKTLGIGQEILSMLPESIPGTRIDRMGLKSTRRWKFVSDQKYVSGQMHDCHFVIVRIQPFRSIACWAIVFLIVMEVFVPPLGSGWSQTVPRCVQTSVITDLNWHIVTQQKSVFWGEPRFLEPRITFERCRVFFTLRLYSRSWDFKDFKIWLQKLEIGVPHWSRKYSYRKKGKNEANHENRDPN